MRSKNFSNNPEIELQRLRNILDSAGDGFIMHDMKGNIVDANETLCRNLGYTLEELLTLRVIDIDVDAATKLDGTWERLHDHNRTLIAYGRHKCKDGRLYPVELKLFAVENDGTHYVSAFVRDISDRKVTDHKLKLTQFAIDHAADAAFWVDVETHKFVYVNIKACDNLGYTQEEFLKMGIPDIDVPFTEDAWPIFIKELKEAVEKTFESELQHKSGARFPVEITASFMEYERKNYVVAFIREISARRKAEIELREAKEKSERDSQAKSQFLTAMSHELKTPLNAIIGYSEMLYTEDSSGLTDEQRHYSSSINQAGHHLLGLIDDVLDLATIESGKVKLEFRSTRLRELLEHSAAITALMAQQKNVSIKIGGAESADLNVWVDKKKLTQVLLNLMSNAIKYNRQNGSVEIEFFQHNDHVQVNIRDTGYGIPAEKQEGLFSPFNRLGKENSDIEGTGVGLVICKSLIELMGGTIQFESKKDVGTCFYFTVPSRNSEQTKC